ncbi:exodeoxyribonuclease VII small subunit [bacterium]|nr:exodeoxyribonuclease VII small subunit [bacterium]
MAKKSFEASMARLEEIVDLLDSGELPLEDAMKIFEEGMKLSHFCSDKLNQVEKRIQVLTKQEDGNFQLELV